MEKLNAKGYRDLPTRCAPRVISRLNDINVVSLLFGRNKNKFFPLKGRRS